MDQTTVLVEILKWGMGGAVLVVVFWKFIPSLFDFLKARSDEDARPHGLPLTNQQRIDRLERELSELRAGVSEMRVAVGISQAILLRIEKSVAPDK